MKRIFIMSICLTLFLAGCSTYQEVESYDDTRVITTEQAGQLELNKHIERPVLFRAADPLNAELLGVPPVGINKQLQHSTLVNEKLDSEFLSPGDFEAVDALNPDAIVTYAPDEHSSTYGEIAPTIEMRYITNAFSPYKSRVYLTHFYYLGVILNKEEEAKEIADEWLETIPKLRRELNEQVTEKNAAVILDENDNYYARETFTSFGTEAVFDVLGFKQTKYMRRHLEKEDIKIYTDEDYSDAELDYLFVATDDLNDDSKKQALAKSFGLAPEQVILLNVEDFRPNDLQSIEYQSKIIIEELNK